MIRTLYRCFGVSVMVLVSCVFTYAQSKTISGTVKDDAGAPMPGVNVLVKGTTTGTSTDTNGAFSLEAQP